MVARTFYAVDSQALTVILSTSQTVGDTIINNSDSPDGTQYQFNEGFSAYQITLEDTGGNPDTFEDDDLAHHVITDGAGLVADGTGVEAESIIRLQELSADGTPVGPVINVYVLSQNGIAGEVWGFATDAPMTPGASYQKVGGNSIGSTDYSAFAEGWLVSVNGTDAAETMGVGYTDAQGDQIDGTDGQNEIIYGYGGDDTIIAGAGNDTILGGSGADSIDGAGGTDTAVYSDSGSAVAVNLVTGTGRGGTAEGDRLSNIENVTGSDHADLLTGDGQANVLDGRAGADTLNGGAGDDTLIGGAGADSLDGGTGHDTADYSASGGGVTINLATGTGAGGDAEGDTLTGIENVTGSDFGDAVLGDGQANVIDGGGGDDTLFGAEGADTLRGGTGNDFVNGGAGADALDGGAGIDTADYSSSGTAVNVNLATGTGSGGDAQGDTLSNFENLIGSDRNDTLTGDGGNNRLDGGSGRDILDGGAGEDVLIGGAGGDSLDGGAGTDWASYEGSGAGVDVDLATGTGSGGDAQGDTITGVENLWGSGHADTLTGDAQDNILAGDAGADRLSGGAGHDTLAGGAGADTLAGGTGTDTAWYARSDSGVAVDLAAGTGSGGTAEGDHISGVENVTGSAHADTLSGNRADNLLEGGAGNDSLSGGAGTDTLDGGAGNDTLNGGEGADSLVGGTGTDTADYSGSASAVKVDLAHGTGSGGDAEGDTLSSIENVSGSDFNDSLAGSDQANVMTGGAGNDSIQGGAGADTLDGGSGADTLAGGTGNDLMTGGAGDDVFAVSAGSGADTISDFDLTDSDGDGRYNDQLDLSGLTDAQGNPIQLADVTVTDDGFGNALLSFPNGETLLLQGVSPAQMSSSSQMTSAGVPCFTIGTLIRTARGERPIERLEPGDLIATLDHGLQPLRWIGRRKLGAQALAAAPDSRPIWMPEGFNGLHSDTLVSPQHGMLLDSALTGGAPALVRAKHLTGLSGAARVAHGKKRVTYLHLLFDRHQIVFANGAAFESFYPGPQSLAMFPPATLTTLAALVPGLGRVPVEQCYGPPARPYLRREETRDLWPIRKIKARAAPLAARRA
ncbi:Hint domain-containing protein [Marinovum sp.]|uniref:Hint domain-containing protein n=1 Tax=Marinovum sp. TaxID=2024839 RepID=UPI002B265071|nr:Hint domain-containing protein [Marinovum sp.]